MVIKFWYEQIFTMKTVFKMLENEKIQTLLFIVDNEWLLPIFKKTHKMEHYSTFKF